MAFQPIYAIRDRHRRGTLLPYKQGIDDGSTLTLDFTKGQLDPRLTFTRDSNATFINSSGLVQYADANMVVNADLVGAGTGNTPTAWTGSTGINLSIPATGVRRAETTTAAMNYIQSANLTTSTGLTYSTSVYVNEVSGQHYTNTLGITGSATTIGYFRNGSSVNQFATALPGLITVVWTATGTHGIRVGIGSTGSNVANAVCEFTQPRTVPGNFTQPTFFANSSTTAAYHAPRFDYDPDTLAPRGLLIEGQATNLVWFSNGLSQNPWFAVCNASITTSTGGTAPDGTNNTASRVSMSAAITGCSSLYYNGVTVTNQQYTHSVFAKADGADWIYLWVETSGSVANGAYFNLTGNGSVGNLVGSGTTARIEKFPNGWYRCQTTSTQPAGTTYPCLLPSTGNLTGRSSMVGTTPGNILVWGDQFEAGSGASSYIPTGASQGSRAADVCYMANADYGFSTSGGTYLAEWHRGSIISTAGGGTAAFATDYASGRWLGIYTIGAGSTGVAGSWAGYLNVSGAVSGINKMAVSYSSWVASASGNTSLNGGAIVSGTLTLGTTPTYLFVGAASGTSPYSGGGYRDPLNNCVRRIKYWPSVLPNAQLQSLTTP